jgi:primary-amine oxidase
MSEMAVPYADPRPPVHRKMAFDFGDVGGGKCANELELGCDCLGTIKYLDGNLVDPDGTVVTRKSVICLHEQDDGLLWKHTNYRTNVARVVRRRVLVVQMILTVGNYEYIFAWHFDQAAGIQLEIRASGVVSTQYIDEGKKSEWGTIVSPGVLAPSHQHIFNVRIDPAVDGYKNTAVVQDTHVVPWDVNNPYGTGFKNVGTYLEKSCAVDADLSSNRYIKIVNESIKNPISGNPVGYKLMAFPSTLLLAQEGSVARKRAAFATHNFWISKYKDQELYAGGVWTNQSYKEVGGVQDAVDRKENVRDEDIVLWHSFGLTHHPRVEDFPVMPVEIIKVGLHPADFFTKSPASDVPQSTQRFNRSVDVMAKRSCHL